MKVSTEIDNNFGYENNTQLVDNIPLNDINLIFKWRLWTQFSLQFNKDAFVHSPSYKFVFIDKGEQLKYRNLNNII
jgi:hypothetical protein